MNENKKAKKVVALLLCAVLLVVGSVTGTMAYLTSKATVTNTFTVGKVAITLDEAKVNAYGEPVDASDNVVILADAPRVAANEYKLVPGHTYVKDPVIHVAAGSEACYLFVKIIYFEHTTWLVLIVSNCPDIPGIDKCTKFNYPK